MVAAAMVFVAGCGVAPGAWAYNELSLTVSGAPSQLIAGDLATLTARVTNNDPVQIGSSIQLNFRALTEDPFGDLPTLSGPGCQSIVPPNVTCTISAALPPGATREFQLTVAVRDLGLVTIQAGAKAIVGDPEDFPIVELTAPQVQWAANVEPKADTKLTLTTSAETVANGAPVKITGLAANTSSDGTAYGTAIKFALPAGVEVVARPPDCTGSAINITCPVGDLGPQATAGREVVLRSTQEGSFQVVGAVIWAREDTTPIDTQGQVSFTVQPPPEAPGPPPATAPKAAAKPKTVSATTLAQGVPRSGACARSRRLSLVLRSLGSWDPVRATIRVTGRRRALVLKGARAQRPFTLTLPRSGRVKLSIAVTLDNGRRYKATRTFRRC